MAFWAHSAVVANVPLTMQLVCMSVDSQAQTSGKDVIAQGKYR